MRKQITLRLLMAAIVFALGATTLSAQDIRSSYFIRKSPVRNLMNPALVPNTGFIAVGGLGINYASNIAVNDVFYDINGKTVLFSDDKVSLSTLEKRLKNNNFVNIGIYNNFFSGGLHTPIGFFNFGMTLKSDFGISIPKEMFTLLKKKEVDLTDNEHLSIKNFRINTQSYTETYVGYSVKPIKKLRVGGRAKILLGIADADIRLDNVEAKWNATTQQWSMASKGSMAASVRGLGTKTFTENGIKYVDGFSFSTPGIAGFGLGFDLGASYEVMDNLTVSASATDLGFIRWGEKSTIGATSEAEAHNMGSEIDTEDILELGKFKQSEPGGRTTSLRASMNFAVEYTILNEMLSFGLLSNTKFYKPESYTELTLVTTVTPIPWFSGALSYSMIHSRFKTFGLVLNFSPPVVNFFIGTDYVITSFKKGLPQDVHGANIYAGLHFKIGAGRKR